MTSTAQYTRDQHQAFEQGTDFGAGERGLVVAEFLVLWMNWRTRGMR